MELFYALPENVSSNSIVLDEFESKHLTHTLRKRSGDLINITDGVGNLFQAIIVEQKKSVRLEIEERQIVPETRPKLALGIGFIRPNRLEFVFEKGTELGVRDFFVFGSSNANYISENAARYEKIIRQALKQSVQFYLPAISMIDSLRSFLKATERFEKKIAAIAPNSSSILQILQATPLHLIESVLVAVGPEGGFTADEENELRSNDFSAVSLGQTRLRSESAAFAAVSAIQIFFHDRKEGQVGNR